MAVLTEVSLDDARALGLAFDQDVARITGLAAGSVNSNFEIATTGGERLFLRVYEEQTEATAKREAALLEHLARSGVPTPRPLERKDGGFIAMVRGKPAALFPFEPGESRCQRVLVPENLRQVGAALAAIHRAGASAPAGLDALVGESRFDREALARRLASLPSSLPPEVAAARDKVATWLDLPASESRITGLIHGDLFRDNVLWDGGRIAAVLDFESASKGSLAFDLMVTMLAWCFGDTLEAPLARALVEGYESLSPIGPDLACDLHREAVFACARFTTTRITDFELRPRGQGVYKDFRRFARRWEAIDRLGPDGLARFLGLAR